MEINIEFKTEVEARECYEIIESMLTDEGVEMFENFIVLTDNCHDQEMAKEICLKHHGMEMSNVQKQRVE